MFDNLSSSNEISQAEYLLLIKSRHQKKKSIAKQIGIKSIMSFGDNSLAITEFSDNNKPNVILKIPNRGTKEPTPYKTEHFTITHIDNRIGITDEQLASNSVNPTMVGNDDYLKLKSVLEKEFFGQEFPNSNIHIQIIHNILDIQKILGFYINDIIYTVNNLFSDYDTEYNTKYDEEQFIPMLETKADSPTHINEQTNLYDDILGKSLNDKKLQRYILRKIYPLQKYLGNIFKIPHINNSKEIHDIDNYNLDILRNLSELRHCTVHWKNTDFQLFSKINWKRILPNWNIIIDMYTNKVKNVNASFIKNSKLNIKILYDLLNLSSNEERENLIQTYYKFNIKKEGKKFGISISRIRKILIESYSCISNDILEGPYLPKINVITDFLIYRCLINMPNNTISTIKGQLKKSVNMEQKILIYQELSEKIWEQIKNYLTSFYTELSQKRPVYFGTQPSTIKIPSYWFEKVQLKETIQIPFVMILSFLCSFLENKEINELLALCINKFENIQSFIDTSIQLNEPVEFTKKYNVFNSMGNRFASNVVNQLHTLASIEKCKKDYKVAKQLIYIEAIKTLGVPDEDFNIQWFLQENVLFDYRNRFNTSKKTSTQFRNFIAKNIIESPRFYYLFRYVSSQTIRALMNNKKIVYYTLSRLPEKKISLYCKRTGIATNLKNYKDILNELATQMTGFSFKSILEYQQIFTKTSKSTDVELKKQQLKEQIGLYLSIAYIVIKQMVKINARYYTAYQILERDTKMTKLKDREHLEQHYINYMYQEKLNQNDYFALLRYYLDNDAKLDYKNIPGQPFNKEECYKHLQKVKKYRHFTKRWRDIFEREISEALAVNKNGYLPIVVRNMTAHLHVLSLIHDYIGLFRQNNTKPMKSYFELYHFLLQSLCLQNKELCLEEYRNIIEKHGIPDNRLIHISYVPFGYNLARYKNLTTEALFDEDSVTGKKRIASLCKKEAWNRIVTAKRQAKSNSIIEKLVDKYIEQFGSTLETQKAIHKGELLLYEDIARQYGKNGIPIENIILIMKQTTFTADEVEHISHVYKIACQKQNHDSNNE